jgi:probable O-glycosylation ligase (exosortase A-associated)
MSCSIMALRHAWIGILGWTWVSIMNPHRLTYGFMFDFPVAAVIGGAALLGILFAKDKKNPFIGTPVTWMTLLTIWMTITLIMAFDTASSFHIWKKVIKVNFMVLMTLVLMNSRLRMISFTWTFVLSTAFFGIKGGLFTILNGGNYRVWGPSGSTIEGNNELAIALIVSIPLIRFLQTTVTKNWQKHALTAAMLLSAAAALGSHSRGALVAIVAMAFMLWLRSPNKLAGAITIPIVGIVLMAFMSDQWFNRMDTISSYQEDGSAMGRINAWWMAWNLASKNLFGGGYEIYNAMLFGLYAPDPTDIHAAHSIYFQILGEHGFIGLFLYLGMGFATWRVAGWLRQYGAENPETRWCSELGAMSQVAIFGFAVGGAFLSLAYWDLPYNLLALLIAAKVWVLSKTWKDDFSVEPWLPQWLVKRIT